MENTFSQSIPNLNTHLNFGNFDPTNLDVEEVVNVTMLGDISGSMDEHKDELNETVKGCINDMQNFSQAPKIYLAQGSFGSDIHVLTGYQQINNVTAPVLNPNEGSTKLYEACHEFLKNMLTQQEKAMQAGILTKNIFFVITDGADNSSKPGSAKAVHDLIDYIKHNEALRGSFYSFLVGIGSPSIFENAQQEMGLHELHTIDANMAPDQKKAAFKKVFGILSASVKSASTKKGPLVI